MPGSPLASKPRSPRPTPPPKTARRAPALPRGQRASSIGLITPCGRASDQISPLSVPGWSAWMAGAWTWVAPTACRPISGFPESRRILASRPLRTLPAPFHTGRRNAVPRNSTKKRCIADETWGGTGKESGRMCRRHTLAMPRSRQQRPSGSFS